MVKRKRVARLPEATAHVSDDERDDEMALAMATAFAQAVAQFTAQEAKDYPDWGRARELAFHSSGGKTEKPAYLLGDKASELPSRPGRKSAKRAAASSKGEFPQALHRSWAAFLVYKHAYERRNGVRLEMTDETSIAQYNSDLKGRVSGRTRGTGSRGGDQKSELPPELQAWQRVFRCSSSADEDHDDCAFGFTATVEFVGNEYMVRVADGVFCHSHALAPVNKELQQPALTPEPVSQAQADTGSPLLRAPTGGSTRRFLDSPPTPPTDDGRLTRGIYLAVRPVANAIIDELMEWKEEYFLSELGNLRDYLARLQQRGREEARRNPVSPVGYDSALDSVGFTFPLATTPSPDPPLYSRLPRVSVPASGNPGESASTPSTISTPVVEAAVAASAGESGVASAVTQRQGDMQEPRAIINEDSHHAVTMSTAKAVTKRRSRTTVTMTNESRSRCRRASIDTAVNDKSKRKIALPGTETDSEKTSRAARRSARSVSADRSSGGGRTTTADDASESLRMSESVKTIRRPRNSSISKKPRPLLASSLLTDVPHEVPAKRRRILPKETTSSQVLTSSKATSEVEVDADIPVEGPVRTDATSDALSATGANEISEPTPSIDTETVEISSETSPALGKSPEETAETAAPRSKTTDAVQDAISTPPVDPPTAALKSTHHQLIAAAEDVVVTTTEPAPKRRSRSQSPALQAPSAPLSVVTEPNNSQVQDTTSKRRKSPREGAAVTTAASATTKPSTTPAAKPSVTRRARSPRVAASPTSKTSEKGVASIDQWLAKMKPSATNTAVKKQKKPKDSQAPVEMFSQFSRYPPLLSFRGQIPATTTFGSSDDSDWDVILVPRSSQVLWQRAAVGVAAPTTPRPPEEPPVGGVLL